MEKLIRQISRRGRTGHLCKEKMIVWQWNWYWQGLTKSDYLAPDIQHQSKRVEEREESERKMGLGNWRPEQMFCLSHTTKRGNTAIVRWMIKIQWWSKKDIVNHSVKGSKYIDTLLTHFGHIYLISIAPPPSSALSYFTAFRAGRPSH